jgi:HlyD family secretion protein
MKKTFSLTAILFALLILGCSSKSHRDIYTSVLEGKSIHVPALTGGQIVAIFVDAGQEVAAGDSLAVIDTTDLVLQRQQAQATREELIVQEDIYRTNLDRARADLDYFQKKYERVKSLYEKQATPEQNLDDLENQLQQVQSAYKAAQDQIQILQAQRKQLEAQLGSIRKKIADAVIVAPTDGLVASRYYEKGEAIPALQPILELLHISELDAKIYIPEEMLSQVKPGQPVSIRVDGLAEDLPGRVSWISPKAEFTPKTILTPETRTSLVYAVKVTVPNPKRVLKHGMPVEVIL